MHALVTGRGLSSATMTCAAVLTTSLLGMVALRPAAPWWLALVVFAPIFAAARGKTPKQALAIGWVSGAILTAFGFRFVPEAAAAVAGWPCASTWGLYALFVAYRASWIGLALGAGALVARRGGRGGLAAVAVLVGLERVCPDPLPFAYGSTLAESSALVQVGDLLGPSGPTLTLALASLLAAEVLGACGSAVRHAGSLGRSRLDRFTVFVAASWLFGATLYGHLRSAQIDETIAASRSLRAELIPLARGAPALGALSRARADADLIVLGEGAIPAPVPESDLAPLLAALMTQDAPAPVLVGATTRGFDVIGAGPARLRNVALLLQAGEITGRYEKHHLLPVAERAEGLFASAGLAAPGAVYREGADHPAMLIGQVPITVTICYEATLSDFMRARVAETRGQLIVNLASDSWFVGSDASALHVLASRMRAIETRRSVLRATHDGISAAIDPAGRVLASAPAGERESVVADVPLFTERTVYARFGVLPLAILLALLFIVSLRKRAGD